MSSDFEASILLFSYNQERYVVEAVESALAQSHDSLEIVISDDASTDSTYELIRETIARYQGPHKIILNRNPANLGMIRHIDQAARLCSGRLIVAMAGDDISLPDRVSMLMRAWDEHGNTPAVLHSRLAAISPNGRAIPTPPGIRSKYSRSNLSLHTLLCSSCGVNGATEAWSRDLFDRFPPIEELGALEDTVFPARALMLGGQVIFVDAVLVQYRVGVSTWISPAGSSSDRKAIFGRIGRYEDCKAASALQVHRDLLASGTASFAAEREEALIQARHHAHVRDLSASPGFLNACRVLIDEFPGLRLVQAASVLRFAWPRTYAWLWSVRHWIRGRIESSGGSS